MSIGSDDGSYYEDRMQHLVESSRGASDKKFSDAKEINTNSTAGDFQSRFYATDASTMPVEASTELTGALKSYGSTKVPENGEKVKRDASQDIYVNPWVTITPEDIDTGMNVAMSAGPGTMENTSFYKNYIDMFLKQPEQLAKGELKPLNVTKDKPPSLDQMPLLDTEAATWHPYSKDQLHPDNFYKVKQNNLSFKQAQDLHDTFHDFKHGQISKEQYLDEMAEYEKFSAMKTAGFEKIPITESNKDYAAKWNEMHGDETWGLDPALTHGKKVLRDLLDDYPELLPKQTPKEKFLDAVEKIDGQLKSTFANIRDKYIKTVKEAKLEPKGAVPAEIAAKGYTEPAYRGVHIYPGKELNPVYDFQHSGDKLYSTSSPMLADMYADYLSKHPGYKVPEGAFKEGSQVMPLYINTKDYHYFDAEGGHWQSANPVAIRQALDAKKKGVIVDNVRDEPASTVSLPPKKIFITFPSGASTVKSRFAKNFDPSSPNILHGIGSVAVAGAAAGYLTNEAERDK